jgi:hypothetical protein
MIFERVAYRRFTNLRNGREIPCWTLSMKPTYNLYLATISHPVLNNIVETFAKKSPNLWNEYVVRERNELLELANRGWPVRVDITGDDNLHNTDAFKNVQWALFVRCFNLRDLSGLKGVPNVCITDCPRVEDIKPLDEAEEVEIVNCHLVRDLSVLKNVPKGRIEGLPFITTPFEKTPPALMYVMENDVQWIPVNKWDWEDISDQRLMWGHKEEFY